MPLPNEFPQLNVPSQSSNAVPKAPLPSMPMEGVPPTSEGRRRILEKKLEDITNKERTFNSEKLIQKNKLEEFKTQLIQNLFRLMQDLGVDPNNLESINSFLSQLDSLDPDLRELFELAFNNLTAPDEISAIGPEMAPNAGLMNRDLSGETFRPGQTENLSSEMPRPI